MQQFKNENVKIKKILTNKKKIMFDFNKENRGELDYYL